MRDESTFPIVRLVYRFIPRLLTIYIAVSMVFTIVLAIWGINLVWPHRTPGGIFLLVWAIGDMLLQGTGFVVIVLLIEYKHDASAVSDSGGNDEQRDTPQTPNA